MEPELATTASHIRQAQATVREITRKLRPDQMTWRPDESSWSIAECISHLTVTVTRYLPMLDAAIEKGVASGKKVKGPFRHGFLSRYFVRMLEPPPSRRFKAPKAFLPPMDLDASKVVPEFLAAHDQLVERVQRANGLDLSRIKVQSPAMALLRLSLGKGLELMAAHARRHLWQAERVMANPNFPK